MYNKTLAKQLQKCFILHVAIITMALGRELKVYLKDSNVVVT